MNWVASTLLRSDPLSHRTGLEVDGLSVTYVDTCVLRDVSFSAGSGELCLLTGASGSGKSTLLRCLNGLIPHTFPAQMTGSVVVNGLDTRQHQVPRLAETVGFVFQNPETQLFNLTVDEEVRFGPRNLGLAPIEVERRARSSGWPLLQCWPFGRPR